MVKTFLSEIFHTLISVTLLKYGRWWELRSTIWPRSLDITVTNWRTNIPVVCIFLYSKDECFWHHAASIVYDMYLLKRYLVALFKSTVIFNNCRKKIQKWNARKCFPGNIVEYFSILNYLNGIQHCSIDQRSDEHINILPVLVVLLRGILS